MNHLRKKSAVAKFAPIAKAGASEAELREAVQTDEAAYAPDEVEIILKAVAEGQQEGPAKTSLANPDEQVNTLNLHSNAHQVSHNATATATPISKDVPGKKRYNIWRGQWHPVEVVRNPFDGKDIVITWEFRSEGKATVTGVPCEPNKAEEFNGSRRLRSANGFTEQMIEIDQAGTIQDKLPNPFEVIKVQPK